MADSERTLICAKRQPPAKAGDPPSNRFCTAVPGHGERDEGVCNFRPWQKLTDDEKAQIEATGESYAG